MAQTYDLDQWLRRLRREIERRTGRRDVEVTGGPYRGYDVRVSEAPDGHPIVDFYSPMRFDPRRVRQAVDYVVSLIENWEATKAEHQTEMRAVRPIFERLRGMFPDLEMEYTVGYGDMHQVNVERDPETGKIKASFDLWPGMKEKDIWKVAGYIKRFVTEFDQQGGGGIKGVEYPPEEE